MTRHFTQPYEIGLRPERKNKTKIKKLDMPDPNPASTPSLVMPALEPASRNKNKKQNRFQMSLRLRSAVRNDNERVLSCRTFILINNRTIRHFTQLYVNRAVAIKKNKNRQSYWTTSKKYK